MNIHDLVKQFVEKKVEQKKINKDEQELYEYAYIILTLQVFNIAVVLLIGLVFRCLFPMILFVAILVPLRSYAGGYHSGTPERCSFLSAAMEVFVALLVVSQVYRGNSSVFAVISLVFSIIIWCLAPVEAVNKPLDEKQTKKYRKITRIILLVEIGLMLGLLCIKYEVGVFVISFCHFCTACSLLTVKILKKPVET